MWLKKRELIILVLERPDDRKDSCTPTTLIIIGYANGVQVWQMHVSDSQTVH